MVARILLLLLLGNASASESPEPRERPGLVLGQGEQRWIQVPGLRRYSAGGDHVRVHSSGDALLIKGVRPGQGDLWVWNQAGEAEFRTVRVEKWPSESSNPALDRAMGRLREVEIHWSGDGVILRGSLRTLEEAARVSALATGFPTRVRNETEISAPLAERAEKVLSEWVRVSGLGERLRVERHPSGVWLRGSARDAREQALLEREARARYALVETEISSLPDSSPTIHFRVFLLELKRSRFGSFGLSWPAGQEAAFRVTPTAIRDAVSLDVALRAMEGEGTARILSKPELVVRAPGEAELFAGGELPIQMRTRQQLNLSWRSYGLQLKLKVTHASGDRVRLDIHTEVSHLDPEISVESVPGIQANRMRTQVDARYGTPLFLSGLLQQGMREQARGIPALRRIPVLGALFGSQDFLNERSELVAILLPQTSPPPAPMERVEQAVRVDQAGKVATPEPALEPARRPRKVIGRRIERRGALR